MPIDKIIPRFLVSDEDERLLKEGAMTDALNVTISEDGDGTEGVIKNIKGTKAARPEGDISEFADNDELVGIGAVNDDAEGYVYFFVADKTGSSQDAIYRYNTVTGFYKLVFKSSWLAFDENNLIKADLIKRDFAGDGTNQTIIYFTDGVNPPRKINVDRAIAGDYNNMSNSNLDFALSTIKAAPNMAPSVRFSKNDDIEVNNFLSDSFQFATQVIYEDGEESAISPYSKIAVSRSITHQGAESYAGPLNQDNVCLISINFAPLAISNDYISDVRSIRLLGRSGNDGAFFEIDEFSPFENKTKNIYDTSVNVYDYINREYSFYNEGVYGAIDPQTVDKLYDNVPLTAKGQAIAGNRLFYSNYTESRDNVNAEAAIRVQYQAPLGDPDASYGSGTGANSIDEGGTTSNGDIEIDLLTADFDWAPGTDAYDSVVSSGTNVRIEFGYDPEGKFYKASDGVITLDAVDDDGFNLTIKFGYSSLHSIPLIAVNPDPTVITNFVTDSDLTVEEVANLIKDHFEDEGEFLSKTYTTILTGQVTSDGGSTLYNVNDLVTISADVNVYYSLDDVTDVATNGAVFRIKPYIHLSTFSNIIAPTEQFTATTQDFIVVSDEQSDITYNITNTTGYITNPVAFATAQPLISSFKAGSTHELGVVYYDKFNRSGFVNKLGSFYVKPFNDRNTGKEGPVSISLTFTSEPPPWATSYQLVYPGASTYESILSYTVGGGYVVRDSSNGHVQDKRRIYVSLKTLEAYQAEKSALRDYSFTPGDKLRVISFDDSNTATPSIQYAKANDGSPVEFDIIGVEVLGDTDNPIVGNDTLTGGIPKDKYKGTFLVLDAPAVDSGYQVEADGDGLVNDSLKYIGFDWFSLIPAAYSDGVTPTQTNYWGRRCVVEILTPRKTVSDKVYYEIGEARRCNIWTGKYLNQHGPPIETSQGDVHWRQVSCKTPFYDSGWGNVGIPEEWRYEAIWIESSNISDYFSSKDWSKGRPHSEFKRAATRRIENGIIYSEAYAEDVERLSLSSFNPSLGNFDSVDQVFGPLNYLGNYNDDLVGIQQNKLSLIPVNKNIIEYAGGSANVAVSTNVLGSKRYATGDYGCGDHQAAVLIRDNSVYFVDESRSAVLRLAGGQLTPISEKNTASLFKEFFSDGHTKYVSGYDPDTDTYFITGLGGTTDTTIGYDASRGVWQSKYSFTPDFYAYQNDNLHSVKWVQKTGRDELFHTHVNKVRNNFYGVTYDSFVQVVSKLSPSRVKVYNALSYEGNSGNWDVVGSSDITTDLSQTTGDITSWRENEGSYYAAMPRDNSSNSTSEEIHIGDLTLGSGTTYTVAGARLNRLPIPLNVDLTIDGETRQVTAYTATTITFDTALSSPTTNMKLELAGEGDVIRGHFSKIKLTLPKDVAGPQQELYCINTHITDSKSHHPLGG